MGMTRRTGIVLLVLALLCANISGGWTASASQTAAPQSGVDLVILLDNSNSMSTMGAKSDIQRYRFDAAAIMLNMISLFSSRVSVITFHTSQRSYKGFDYKNLTNVAMLQDNGSADSIGAGNRTRLTTALIEEPIPEGAGTLIGTALTEAVKVLDSGSGERNANGNKPMILLLADGKISPSNDDRRNTTASEKALIDQVLADCQAKGYTIYSVVLKNADNKDIDQDSIDDMYRWASTTGGTAHVLDNPAALPEVFSQMFGEQIGSSMVSYQPSAQPDGAGGFFIEIDIPNKSVEEANILLQTEGLSDFKLFRPNGEEARPDGQHIFKPQVGDRFTQYKIFRPTENGKWRLTFKATDSDPNNISVNILYNYTETLEVEASPSSGPYQKGTQLTLSAQLFKDGAPSTDQLLYRKVLDKNNENIGIRAWANLTPASVATGTFDPNKVISRIELPVTQLEDRFERTFTLRDFTDAGGNPLEKAGDYVLYVHVEGAGLVRDSDPIPYKVDNQAPVVTTGSIPTIVIEINDPKDKAYGSAKTGSIDFGRHVVDNDGDVLTPKVRIADTVLVQEQEPFGDLKVDLLTQGKAGETKLYFQVSDNERATLVDGSKASLPAEGLEIDVKVVSVIDELKGAFSPMVTITSARSGNGYFEKNSTVQFEVSVEGSHNDYNIAEYKPVMRVFHENADRTTGEAKTVDLVQKTPTTWTGSLQLDDRANHELRAELLVITPNQEELLIQDSSNDEITTGNAAPQVLTDKVKALRAAAEVEPFTLLKQEGTEPWTVILDDLFTDANIPFDSLTFTVEGEKVLVGYGDVVLGKEEPSDKYELGRDIHTVTFTPKNPGKAAFKLIATDESGEKAEADYVIEVTSMTAVLREKAIRYGLIALAALILFLIIKRIIKPSFKGMKLTRKRDGNLHGETVLPGTKATLPLSQFADETMLRDVGMGKMNLKHIRLKAGRSHILVMMGKGNHLNAIIKVGNETLSPKRRKAKLSVGRELQVSLNDHTISWLLQMNAVKGKAAPAPVRRGPNM